MELHPLLAHIVQYPHSTHHWLDWQITPVAGGANNRLYRATNADSDLAIKWTIRDERDRAGREYAALQVLRDAGLDRAPQSVLLERDRYAQPVVVQTWLDGPVLSAPPATDAEWTALVEHYAAIHQLRPQHAPTNTYKALVNASSPTACRDLIAEHVDRIPSAEHSAELLELLRRWESDLDMTWPEPDRALCRVDANTTNFIRRVAGWASVDWENSGWGDPAFEIAELMTHPAYTSVHRQRWAWVVDRYVALHTDPTLRQRITVYYPAMLVWWVVRLARYIYEVPRGDDPRLVARPTTWLKTTQANYRRYLALAQRSVKERYDHQ